MLTSMASRYQNLLVCSNNSILSRRRYTHHSNQCSIQHFSNRSSTLPTPWFPNNRSSQSLQAYHPRKFSSTSNSLHNP